MADIRKVKKHIAETTYREITSEAARLISLFELQKHNPNGRIVFEFLRTHQTQIGALITATDWQSPSFLHTNLSQAGRQTNSIYATINDYKRDQHWDAHRYERAFLREYIDGFIKFSITVCATSSGMSAFSTILNFLILEQKADGKILIGRNMYFENKGLVADAFGPRIVRADEHDTEKFLSLFDRHKPAVVFLDSLANAPEISVPALGTIIRHIVKHAAGETYLVIDNTGLTCMFQPFRYFFGKRTHVRLIVLESLNKYHQFGMDRVTGGIIWAYGKNTEKLFDYRVHLGTNIPDIIAASLPTPNRKMLTRRLLIHSRNATLLAGRLQNLIDSRPDSPFSHISFPGLPGHPAHSLIEPTNFYGSYFTVVFKKRFQTISTYKRFVGHVMRVCKKTGADILSGSSFGLPITRIYLTAVRSTPHIPFIRVAVGTENRQAIEALADALYKAFNSFR